MNKSFTLKGIVSSQHYDTNGEILVNVTAPFIGSPFPQLPPEPYKFEPYANISLRASDLGNPPLGATVEIEVRLS
jgi:hypothetical protein